MLKVMFVCCAGMSTSLLVEKVLSSAKEKGVELELYAVGEADARRDLAQADILLLGPQVRYLESKFRTSLEGSKTKLGVCDMRAYGCMDGDKVLAQILELASQ